MSGRSTSLVTVNWKTVGNTAITGVDFINETGMLSFNYPSKQQQFQVTIIGDNVDEANKNFYVDLSTPVRSDLNTTRGVCTIIDAGVGMCKFNYIEIIVS